MVTRWAWVWALLIAAMFATPATAQLVPCPSEPIETVVKLARKTFHCIEVERDERAGVIYRIVTDKGTPESALAPYRAMIRGIVDRTFTTWREARAVTTHGVSFVLLPTGGFTGNATGSLALTPYPTLGWDGEAECVVMVDLARITSLLAEQKATTNREDFLGLTVAHELAHCLQTWNWPRQRMARDANWWVEGIAEVLGAVAYPGAVDIFRRRYPLFKKTAATVPLTRMSYESVVFFQWVWNQRHADVFAFMDAMPSCQSSQDCSGTEEAAQRKATIAFLGKAQGGEGGARLQVFAQDFVDNAIPNAAGAPVGPPNPAPKQLVAAAAEVSVGGAPWTIQTRDLTVTKGDYTVLEFDMLQSARARDAKFPAPWGDLPHKVRPGCEGQAQFKLAFVPLNETAAKARYRLDQDKGCDKTPAAKVDACATGTWTVDADSHKAMLASWLGKDGRVDAVHGSVTFTFGQDGVARMEAKNFTAEATPIVEIESHVSVAVSGVDEGPWSTEGGRLTFTGGKGNTLSTVVKMTVGPISRTVSNQFLFERGSIYDYTCGAGTLVLRYAGPRSLPADRRPMWRLVRQ
jgi:hypothetical protein